MIIDIKTLLSSLITASSIVFAVSIPFIILFVTNHQNNKDKLLSEIRPLTAKLKSYIKFIYHITTLDFWKNKKYIKEYVFAITGGDHKKIKELEEEDYSLTLYKCFFNLQKVYFIIYDNYNNYSNIFTSKELMDFQIKVNWIWYYEDRKYEEYHTLLNKDAFFDIDKFKLSQIRKLLSEIDKEYSDIDINPNTVAMISGDVEVDIINPLQNLTLKYERSLNSICKKLFSVNIISLFFGIIIPLIILNFNNYWTECFIFIISTITTIFTIISFILIVFFVNNYIKSYKS